MPFASSRSIVGSPTGEASWPADWLRPAWPHPVTGVGAVMTTRSAPGAQGLEPLDPKAPYGAFNLGDHVGDDPAAVRARREALAHVLGATPTWLNQVHGARVVRLSAGTGRAAPWVDGHPWPAGQGIDADGSWTSEPGCVCTVMVADCLPVLLAAPEGRGVAALHAGWRGLCGAGPEMSGRGILEAGVAALCEGTGCEPRDLQAWLGACIGPSAFEVGGDVLLACEVEPTQPHGRFTPHPTTPGKWWADLAGLAMDRLQALGVMQLSGAQWCTVSAPSRFFSFRRDRVTGRQAACIWLDPVR